MKKLFAFAVTALVAGTALMSCGGGKGISSNLKDAKDSVSYAHGLMLAEQIKGERYIVVEKLAAGLIDGYYDKGKFEREEVMNILSQFMNFTLPEMNLKASEEYLASIEKNNPNIQKTESGLLYEILVAGDPEQKLENDADRAAFVYHGELSDGYVFDSSRERGDTITFEIGRLIPGWIEGMKLIGKGGKIKLWLPSELGYGAGQGPGGPNQALFFEVDLVDVFPADAPAEQ